MEFFCVAGGPLGRLVSPHSSLRLLLLVTAQILLVSGQSQVGVSLRFRGAALPNDSTVDLDDVMYTEPSGPESDLPSNINPRDEAVLCVTDLVDCCGTESGTVRAEHGDWYLPDGTRVGLGGSGAAFQANRGPNEVVNGQRIYGSVRLYRRYGGPPGRGRFRCELPSAADPSINQILYVIILQFGIDLNLDHVIFSPSTGSTTTTAGDTGYSLTCSSTLYQPPRLPSGLPSPNFQWFFGGSTSLPSGVTAMPTVVSSSNSTSETYASTLQFSPLSQSHAGMYTCRLGPERLENNVMVTVNAPPITVSVTANLNTPLMVGVTDNTPTCGVSGAGDLNPTTTYRWTRDGGREVSSSSSLPLSPVGLSDAGNYTCHATVNSDLLTNDIIRSTNQIVMVQVPASPSVAVSSSTGSNIILNNSAITVNCEVNIGQGVSESELSLLMVEAQLFRDGTPLMLADPVMRGSSFILESEISSFNDSNVGNYSCTATVRPAPSSRFLTGTGQGTSPLVRLTIGIPPISSRENATCTGCYSGSDIAIAVVVLILIECLLAAPVITAVMVICWKRNQRKPSQYKSTSDATTGDVHLGEDVYEDPDRTAATTTPGSFKLTECPAYVTTTASSPQPTGAEAQLQSGYYEL